VPRIRRRSIRPCKILREKLGKDKTLRERQEKNESVALDILQRKGEDPTKTATDPTALTPDATSDTSGGGGEFMGDEEGV